MLESDDGTITCQPIAHLPCKIALPCSADEFFGKRGAIPTLEGDLRRFQRLHYRNRAGVRVMRTLPEFSREEIEYLCYTRDISREGIGFLYHEQLFPRETCHIRVPDLRDLVVRVTTCRFVAPRCYEIGATFVSLGEQPA